MENNALGFGHFLLQADAVGKTLLAILLVMSVASWALIAVKGLAHAVRKRRSESFLTLFWNATSLDEVHAEIATHGVREPFAHLAAHAMHARRPLCAPRRTQAGRGRQRAGVPDAHGQEGARRRDHAAGKRPHAAGHRRRDRAFRRLVRHRVGRVPRAGGHRHERRGHARQGGRPGRRGADHDRHRAGGRHPRGDWLQHDLARQPRAGGQARCVRVRADVVPHARPVAAPERAGRAGDAAAPGGGARARLELAMAFASFDGKARLGADVGHQHGAADRRDAGAAGDLHHHRAAAHARGEARPAQGQLDAEPAQARQDRVRRRRHRPALLERRGRDARRGGRAFRCSKARSIRSPRSTCAPTMPRRTAWWPRRWPMRRKAGLSKIGFVSEPEGR